jgi:uracil-DNA glycosylase
MPEVKMEASWKESLVEVFKKPPFLQAVLHLKTEIAARQTIYPPGSLIFNAFNSTSFHKVKVVIIGQDPYHGAGQAMGLSFSVQKGVKPPPSLMNIFKELKTDIGLPIPAHGDLTHWAQQGVLLLNATLTVRANEPNSHAQIGWQGFTDEVIKLLSAKRENLVFLLWGKFAQEKISLIDETRHYVMKAAHPSPFSVEKGFYGCRHFSRTNQYLMKQGIAPIDWSLS